MTFNDGYLLELLDFETDIKRKPKDSVEFNEVVEIFVSSTVPDIMSEDEVPKVNFLFSDEAILWLRGLLNIPFKKSGCMVKNMTLEDIELLSRDNQNDSDCPTILVKDYILFFKLLTDIVNEQVGLYYEYGRNISARSVSLMLLRRIWLRMNVEDFNDVELFLRKQLDFVKNREFDKENAECQLGFFDKYTIICDVEMCETWCESTRRMCFRIYDGFQEYHDLPKVYYDVCEENGDKVCYISAIQNGRVTKKIKTVERKLYKLNKNIPDSKVHPNFVMAMGLFYEVLRKHNISHIKVPVMQVLSYRYHELLSNQEKELYEKKWNLKQLEYLYSLRDSTDMWKQNKYDRLMEEYEWDKLSYERFVDKEDFISKNKIEGLINLFMSMLYIDSEMVINTEPYIDASYLDISIDGGKKINKR